MHIIKGGRQSISWSAMKKKFLNTQLFIKSHGSGQHMDEFWRTAKDLEFLNTQLFTEMSRSYDTIATQIGPSILGDYFLFLIHGMFSIKILLKKQ